MKIIDERLNQDKVIFKLLSVGDCFMLYDRVYIKAEANDTHNAFCLTTNQFAVFHMNDKITPVIGELHIITENATK